MLWECLDCTTRYAAGLPRCPHDGSTNYQVYGGGGLDLFTVEGHAEDIYRPSMVTPPRIQPAQILTLFQASHGFTNNAGSTFTANDTADFIAGTQACKIVTGGLGAQANVSRVGMPAFDTTDRYLRIRFKLDDDTYLAGFNVFLGSSAFANNYKWAVQTSPVGSNFITSGEWVTLTLSWHDATVTGTPDRAALTDVRLQVIDNAAGTVTAHYQSVELIPDCKAVFPNGVVSITFDDCWDSVWDYARPRMDLYGYPGSIYTIAEFVGGSGRLTLAEVLALQDRSGWEIASHAYTDEEHSLTYTGMTAVELANDCKLMKAFAVDNGLNGADGTAYPLGQYGMTADDVSTTAIMRQYFAYGRTTHSRTKETVPPADLFRLRALSTISGAAGGVTASSITTASTGELAKCKANRSWLILVFHKITTGTAANTTECSQTDFNAIVDAVNSQGIPVHTVSDVLRIAGRL